MPHAENGKNERLNSVETRATDKTVYEQKLYADIVPNWMDIKTLK